MLMVYRLLTSVKKETNNQFLGQDGLIKMLIMWLTSNILSIFFYNIDINSVDAEGMTALHYVAHNFYNYRQK